MVDMLLFISRLRQLMLLFRSRLRRESCLIYVVV
jgi:hypothetical protein